MKITVHCINPKNMAYWNCAKNAMKTMDFEGNYMPGAVAAEMGDCSEIEALKAQAVVARSFAYQYILKDAAIYDTGAAQAFLALRAVSDTYALHRQAAEDTSGIILTYNGKPVSTHYSASNGGYVQTSSNAWEPGGYDDPYDDSDEKSGHGSGMSQNGAENMAKNGMTYQEILAFYYPGTVLMGDYGDEELEDDTVEDDETAVENEETSNDDADIADGSVVIDFCRDQVGKKYKLGASGPTYFDCSGLTMKAVSEIGYSWYHGATTSYKRGFQSGEPAKYGYWKANGTIDTMPDDEVCFLFNRSKTDSSKMAHVAVYDPVEESVIQAGGYCGTGVHENPFSQCKSHFTHWCTLKALEASGSDDVDEVESDTHTTIRYGSSGDLVEELQELLNEWNDAQDKPLFDELEVDGKYGRKTKAAVIAYQRTNDLKVDGIVGSESWTSLLA